MSPFEVVTLSMPMGKYPKGTIGTILDKLPAGDYLIEIANEDGVTFDILIMQDGEFEVVS